jgi:hypothetical protein
MQSALGFLTVVTLVVLGVHLYFWKRLVRDTKLPPAYRKLALGALILCAASMFASRGMRSLPPDAARWLAWPAYVLMGLLLLLFLLLVIGDIYRLTTYVGTRAFAPERLVPARRTFLARALTGAAGAGSAALGGVAVAAARTLTVREVDVRLAKLPKESHGMTIAQITDLHVGPTIGRGFVEDVVRRTNALAADLVVITGDLVDGSVEQLRDATNALGELRARHGVYFVTGNHEFYSGAGAWMAELRRLGIQVLDNRRVAIGEPGAGLDLAGVHDFSGFRRHGRIGGDELRPDLTAALAGRDPSRCLVLLAHQPRAILEAAERGVCLQISGHTHGGQIWPLGLIVKFSQPYLVGLHQHGASQIYVSPGTGYWGPPMRVGTIAQITRLRLLSGQVA